MALPFLSQAGGSSLDFAQDTKADSKSDLLATTGDKNFSPPTNGISISGYLPFVAIGLFLLWRYKK